MIKSNQIQGNVYDPADYGIMGTLDDAPVINAAIAAMPAGGTLFLPAGKINCQTPVNITKNIRLTGHGCMDAELKVCATLLYSTQDIDIVKVTAPGVILDSFGVERNRNAATIPTQGSGVSIDIRVANDYSSKSSFPIVGSSIDMERVSVLGTYDGIAGKNLFESNLDKLRIHGFVRNGIMNGSALIPDAGDTNITNSFITADLGRNGLNAIFQATSGGMKVLSTKINSRPGALLVNGIVGDFAAETVILLIGGGTSIENFTGWGVDVQHLALVNIFGLGSVGRYVGSSEAVMRFRDCQNGLLSGVSYQVQPGGGYAAQFRNCLNFKVTGNQDDNFHGGGAAAYDIDNSNVNVRAV